MIKDLSHYCFDGGPWALVASIFFVLYALLFIWLGTWEPSSGRLAERSAQRERERWSKELRSWDIGANEVEAERMIPTIGATWRGLQAPALVGTGIGIFIAFCLLAIASAKLTGTLLLLTSLDYTPTYVSAFFFGAAGYTTGLAYGARRLRREHAGAPRYADAGPRLLRSYRSSLVPLLLLGFVLYYALATIIEAPYISGQLHIDVAGGTNYLIPKSSALLALPIIGMLIGIGVLEALAAQIAAFPRLVSGLTPSMAIRIDDALRAKAIMMIEGAEVTVTAGLALTGSFMTEYGMGYAHSQAANLLGLISVFVAIALGIAGVVRLSGRQLSNEFTDWLYMPRSARWRTRSSS